MQAALLNIHNTDRNKIATGSISPYTAAANMAAMTWDAGLAASCQTNVQTCTGQHDLPVGQNLAQQFTTQQTADVSPNSLATLAGSEWFDKEVNSVMKRLIHKI